MSDGKLLYSVNEAARLLNMSRSSLYSLMGEKRLAWVNFGRRRLIHYSELERFAASLEKAA
jgi:excisionase family DNA binding protein